MNAPFMSIAAHSPQTICGALRVMTAGAVTWEVKLHMDYFAELWLYWQLNNHSMLLFCPAFSPSQESPSPFNPTVGLLSAGKYPYKL